MSMDARELARLWDGAFPVGEGRSYTDDFPIWNCERLAREGQIAFFKASRPERHGIVSVAAVRLARLRAHAGSVPIALIGGVATTPEARGQGLASQCVRQAMDWARRQGAALIALWGSEHGMYRKLGFELCGEQARVPVQALLTGAAREADRPIAVHRGWTPGLMAPLLEREGGLRLAPEDSDWLSAHAGSAWYWTGAPERPAAYAVLGRGIDLQHLVHEWGGARSELEAILRVIGAEDPDAQVLGHPSHLRRKFEMKAETLNHEFLALVHVADPVALIRAYRPLVRVSGRLTQSGWDLAIEGTEFRGQTPSSLARFLFGPGSPWAELPFWVWGLDAV